MASDSEVEHDANQQIPPLPIGGTTTDQPHEISDPVDDDPEMEALNTQLGDLLSAPTGGLPPLVPSSDSDADEVQSVAATVGGGDGVLAILKKEGIIYSRVVMVPAWNLPERVRPATMFWCKPCNIWLNDDEMILQHVGTNHHAASCRRFHSSTEGASSSHETPGASSSDAIVEAYFPVEQPADIESTAEAAHEDAIVNDDGNDDAMSTTADDGGGIIGDLIASGVLQVSNNPLDNAYWCTPCRQWLRDYHIMDHLIGKRHQNCCARFNASIEGTIM